MSLIFFNPTTQRQDRREYLETLLPAGVLLDDWSKLNLESFKATLENSHFMSKPRLFLIHAGDWEMSDFAEFFCSRLSFHADCYFVLYSGGGISKIPKKLNGERKVKILQESFPPMKDDQLARFLLAFIKKYMPYA